MDFYYVSDIVPKDKSKIKYIFIFESPHKTEIETKVPVSGMTGKYILNQLKLKIESVNNFGIFAKNRYDTVILNISNYPLQKINSDIRLKDELEKLKIVRKSYKALFNHRKVLKDTIGNIEQNLFDSFQKRFNEIYNKGMKVIICGRFAEAYFKKLELNLQYNYMPHPSKSGWKKLNDFQQELLKELQNYYHEQLSVD